MVSPAALRFISLFFSKADDMLKRRLGDEEALFAELVKQYSAEEEPDFAALVRKLENCVRDFYGCLKL